MIIPQLAVINPNDRIAHTSLFYTSCRVLAGTRNSLMSRHSSNKTIYLVYNQLLIKDFYLNDNATMAEIQGRPFNKIIGMICRSVVRVFSHGAIGCRIDPSWWTH